MAEVRAIRKTPEIVTAIQFDGTNDDEIAKHIDSGGARRQRGGSSIAVLTDAGYFDVHVGEWLVVTDWRGLVTYSDDEFRETFEIQE